METYKLAGNREESCRRPALLPAPRPGADNLKVIAYVRKLRYTI